MDERFRLERVAARAWPAAEAVERDGWLLRATPGVTRRRSWSALPLRPEPGPVEAVESFFAARGARPLVQVAPLGDLAALDALLAGRGWEASGATDVLVAGARGVARPADVAIDAGPGEGWLAAWAAERGAKRPYLQTEAGDAPAHALFAGAGFTRSHGYHYRAAPR